MYNIDGRIPVSWTQTGQSGKKGSPMLSQVGRTWVELSTSRAGCPMQRKVLMAKELYKNREWFNNQSHRRGQEDADIVPRRNLAGNLDGVSKVALGKDV